jgi:DNA-binding CsgD family transcriptional regulator
MEYGTGSNRTSWISTDLPGQGTLECNPLVEILNHLAVAVIVVDRQLRIVHANAAARELLSEGSVLSSVRGALTANDARNHEALRRVIREPGSDTRLVCLETERRVTLATVLPLSSGLRETHGKWCSASAAVFVQSQPSFDKGLENALGTVFRLTGVESRVLSALVEGLSLPAIATRHQISVSTVRWHLKQLFAKTNTRRQSDLIRIASAAIAPVRAIRKEKSGEFVSQES